MSAPMSDERLAAIAKSTDYMDPRESDAIAELLAEVERLRAELSKSNRERDEARRAVCERAALGLPGHESFGDYVHPADAARCFGWGYLYPEESDE